LGAAGGRPGGLDPSFGRGGKVLTDFNEGSSAIQPNGAILAAGATAGTSSAFALARYKADGSLDSSFGNGGKVQTSFGIGVDAFASAIALQPNGKAAIVVGRASAGNDADFALARYNSDGTLDSRFASNGMVLTDFGGFDGAVAVALQASGGILVAGNSDEDVALARYNADGSLDSSFGTDGKVLTDFGGFGGRAYAMLLQADGKIIVAGEAEATSRLLASTPTGSSIQALATTG